MMKTYICVALVAIWMLVGGTAHMIVPHFFFPFVPDFLPQLGVVYVSGLIELAIGIAVLFPKTRAKAGLAFAALCLAFLPLHVWDLLREEPIITPTSAAIFRIIWQFVLIGAGWYLWTRENLNDEIVP